jgi:hypothetical protein
MFRIFKKEKEQKKNTKNQKKTVKPENQKNKNKNHLKEKKNPLTTLLTGRPNAALTRTERSLATLTGGA